MWCITPDFIFWSAQVAIIIAAGFALWMWW